MREGTSERLIGGLSFTEGNDALASQTYCFRSIITIAKDVSSSMSANTPDSDSSILIISSSIYSSGLKISSKVLLANS